MNGDFIALYEAMLQYSYPKWLFDIETNREWEAISYSHLERCIQSQLRSSDLLTVKAGLANVVYWGNAQQGTRYYKVEKFIADVTEQQLVRFSEFLRGDRLTPSLLRACDVTYFSQLSFVSKVLMFLDPDRYVTLDLQLAQLGEIGGTHVLSPLHAEKTGIRISEQNAKTYDSWCLHCKTWADAFPACRGVRAVDVERGIFGIVQRNGHQEAVRFLLPPGSS
jgi:hypothetical protein